MLVKLMKALGLATALLVFVLVSLFFLVFGSQQKPRSGPSLGTTIEQVADGFTTVYILDAGPAGIVLIDAGNDPKGKAILEALQHRGKRPADVAAVFITHAHPDHDAAIALFPRAQTYTLQNEVALAEGKEPYHSPIATLMGQTNPHPFRVNHALQDGETIQIGTLKLTAFEVSGHTPGSAAYLAQGVVFLGDAATFTSQKEIKGPIWIFSRDSSMGVQSLKNLLIKLQSRLSEIEYFTTSHTGTLPKRDAVTALENLKSP